MSIYQPILPNFGQILKQAIIRLNNEQIKNLGNDTGYYPILSGPGEGKIIIFDRALIVNNILVPYVGVDNDYQWNIVYENNGDASCYLDASSRLVNPGHDYSLSMLYPLQYQSDLNGYLEQLTLSGISDLNNSGLMLGTYNSGEIATNPLTGGDDANYILITISYYIYDIETGQFVI